MFFSSRLSVTVLKYGILEVVRPCNIPGRQFQVNISMLLFYRRVRLFQTISAETNMRFQYLLVIYAKFGTER